MRDSLIVIADAHLTALDADTAAFCAFLSDLPADAAELVLLGDIFALWIAHPKHTLAHHTEVLQRIASLRAAGVRVRFIEGNREFGVARWQAGWFDAVHAAEGEPIVDLDWGGRRWSMAHGDRLDPDDWRTRLLHRLLRAGPTLQAVAALPAGWGMWFGRWLERSLRHRNLRYKTALPTTRLQRHARQLAERGAAAGVIGHIHVAHDVQLDAQGRSVRLLILPDWRSTHEYLRIDAGGGARFEIWRGASGVVRRGGFAVVAIEGLDPELTLTLEAELPAGALASGSLASGHGGGARTMQLLARQGRRITVRLGAGAPVQIGDRVEIAAGRRDETVD